MMFYLKGLKLLVIIIGTIQSFDCHEINKTLVEVRDDSLIISPDYHKWTRPSYNAGKLSIAVSMQMDRFAFYNDIESLLKIQTLLEFKWLDPRLQFDCNNTKSVEGNHLSADIWTPDIQLSRSEDVDLFNSNSKSKLIFLCVYCDGRVLIRFKSNLNLICVMNYQKFPFDEQTCRIQLISNDLTDDHINLVWNTVLIEDDFYMSGHLLKNYSSYQGVNIINQENFSVLTVELNLQRQFIHYMLVLFLPSILIVATSWASFWIDITSPPSRVTLSVTTLLAMVTVMKESKQDLPKVSYIKAIDLWFVGCIVSIFLSMIEYLIVSYVYREERNKLKTRKRIKRSLSAASFSSFNGVDTTSTSIFHASLLIPGDYNRLKARRFSSHCSPTSNGNLSFGQHNAGKIFTTPNESPNTLGADFGAGPSSSTETMDYNNQLIDTPQEVAEAIERKCRYLFPLTFTLFNLIYWSYM